MSASKNLNVRAGLLSVLIFLALLGIWYIATASSGTANSTAGMTAEQIEYAKMMGKDPGAPKSGGFPTLGAMGSTVWSHLSNPFYDNGPNDKGIAIQLAHSLGRVALGFGLACLVAIPLGFIIGMSPLLRRAFDPFIQVLKPISPLAWMPLALYTIKDSSISGIFVIFICSIWPMVINTAVGVQRVPQDYLNVARVLHLSEWKVLTKILFPSVLPYMLTGVRLSVGTAWLVIVAAEMLTGGVGIGFWVWDEWNNLKVEHIIIAIFVIGIVGLVLEYALVKLATAFTFEEVKS